MTRIYRVCSPCYDLYNSEKKLSELEKKFANVLGI